MVHGVLLTVSSLYSKLKQRRPPCLISSQNSCPIKHGKHALWCLGALWVVAKAPQVLLDVGGDIHHVRPHPGLHLPVWELHDLLVQRHGHGPREVSLATDQEARTGYFCAAQSQSLTLSPPDLTFHFSHLCSWLPLGSCHGFLNKSYFNNCP